MSNKQTITNIHDLKLAQARQKLDIVEKEQSFELEWDELKSSFMPSGSDLLESGSAKEFIQKSSPLILQSLSDLIIDRFIRPKSELVKKLFHQLSSFLIHKAEPIIEDKLS